MTNTVRIKRRASGAAGAPATLANAEVAFNEVDDILYYGKGTGGSGGSATTVEAIGGKGAFVNLTDNQTVAGVKTFSSSPIVPTPTTGTQVANKDYVDNATPNIVGGTGISVTGTTTKTIALDNTGTAGTYTKVTTNAQGQVTSGTTLSASDIPTITASKISDFDTQVRTSRLDQMASPTTSVSLNSQKITSLAEPTASSDAATKNYVDTVAQGIDAKASVKAASTANLTLSGTQTVDGIALVAGDRILVKNQSTAAENGIYVVDASTWSRSSDANAWAELISAYVFVEGGSVNADNGYLCTVDAGGTIDVTAVTWVQFSGAGQITAGAGLIKTGNQLDVVGTSDRITVNADSVDIASTYVGQTSITTLGTVGTGTWNATTIGTSKGGTGLTSFTSGGAVYASSSSALTTGTLPVTAGGTGVATLTGIVKGNGTSAFSAATAGTDYLDPSSTIDGGTF
jgi:hypothetical protein